MESELAQVKFPGMGEEGEGADDDEGSECEATKAMVASQNRKGRKSGGFQSMGFSYAVFKGVMKKGYRVPTPIQRKCIPLVMDGKDVVAMARTGSGKTAAFLLPMFEHLKAHSTKIGARAVVLSPTRELATQTFKFTKELGKFTSLRAVLVLGGDSMEDQFSAIHGNPDIIIATPGRFLHLVVEMDLSLSSVEYVVFDEADRLFEMGFAEQLHDIVKRFPESRQALLFSATLPRMLVEFAKAGLKDPVLVRLDVDSKLSDQLKVFFLSVRREDKASALLYLLQSVLPATDQTAVFAPTKHHVEYLKELLEQVGIPCTCIYSSLDQTARKINVAKFTNKKVMTMLVTDVAARGIDIPTLDNVVNYDFPAKSKLFVHRVGRVARAGRSGCAYSLISPDEVPYMIDLHLFLGRPLRLGGQGSGVYGSVPQSLLDQEDARLKQLLLSCPDLEELKRVSENAHKQYVRSRGQPAPESVKRAKKLPDSLPVHCLFEGLCSPGAMAQCRVLDSLKQYKPAQTIFEIHSTQKTTGKQIMQSKRNLHSAVIETSRQQARKQETLSPLDAEVAVPSSELTLEDIGKVFQTEHLANQEILEKRKKGHGGHAGSSEHYIGYAPRDVHSEKGLSLSSSFDRQANSAVLDLEADEEGPLHKSQKKKQWDRKRKKFVGESEKESVKKKRIKTESGQWIRASFKSNAYKEWKDKHKIEAPLAGCEEEGGGVVGGQRSGAAAARRRYGRSNNNNNNRNKMKKAAAAGPAARRPVGDLKSKAAILKKRQRKEAMEHSSRRKAKHQQQRTDRQRKSGRGFQSRARRN